MDSSLQFSIFRLKPNDAKWLCREKFWLNPDVSSVSLSESWFLNNNVSSLLILLHFVVLHTESLYEEEFENAV